MNDAAAPAGFIGIGSYAPERILTNADLERMVDTSDEWIVSRTGIRSRHIARADEFTSDLAAAAASRAIANANLKPSDIDYVLLATACPDNPFPSTAAWVTHKLGIRNAGALDVSTACTGFIYAAELATSLVNNGMYRNVLAIGAEKLSAITDWTDRNTCVLFGDASGAAVISRGGHRVVTSRVTCDFNYDALHIKSGGSRVPFAADTFEKREHCIRMNGREVYRFVVAKSVELVGECLDRAKLRPEDIALFVPHQANELMLRYMIDKVGIPPDRMVVNIDRYGNTSSASIPVALDEVYRAGRIKPGDYVLLVAFGGGLSSGYMLLQW